MWQVIIACVLAVPVSLFLIQILAFVCSALAVWIGIKTVEHHIHKDKEKGVTIDD